ncbi:hypothetical protein F2P56_004179 [Juglans regia]|uniref:Calcium load-activated calcium channel-like n=1 Tax=Juglans regia TaxID=51240 RepID=A0A833Y7M2_JUGRE|nr:hypothetical protein F2P56_004179 [Juglans regia]
MALPQIFSSFKYSDSLTVVAISFCTAILCEAISWLLIYRINSYKSSSSIDKAAKKLETMKTESLKESSRDLSLFKFKSDAVVALVLFVFFCLRVFTTTQRQLQPLPHARSQNQLIWVIATLPLNSHYDCYVLDHTE